MAFDSEHWVSISGIVITKSSEAIGATPLKIRRLGVIDLAAKLQLRDIAGSVCGEEAS
jgi:hypothetical protein